ncbi:hypothetical protein BHM03_00002429 [Ensete ventricosum]|nr:hypothetical protein BHM03_00002429 [Ensete ventricosum]
MGYDSRKVDPNRSLCTDPHFGSDDLTGISLYWFRCYICLKFGIGRLGEAHPSLLRLALGSSYRHDSLPLVGRVTLSRTLVSFSAMLQKMLFVLRPSPCIPLRRFLCKCSAPDMSRYREAFARRMAMAGIKPHHRIALGVSGGPDSMALCVLTAGWKLDGSVARNESSGFIDGILGIVVDHRLRAESTEEAILVRDRVTNMGNLWLPFYFLQSVFLFSSICGR